MQKALVAAGLVALVAFAAGGDNVKPAQDTKQQAKKERPAVSLKVGDLAPALKASKWHQGAKVTQFERGKVYVVEFWATWCGLCVHLMPHNAELQAEYRNRGVTFIYCTARDPDNTEEQVAAFVRKRGPKFPFTFAYGDDRTTFNAWMKAAGREGLPCAFVVDRSGRIAYIGTPIYLGVVLPRVLAADAKAQTVSAEVSKIVKEWESVSSTLFPDHKAGLKALKAFEAKYPALTNNPVIVRVKLSLLPMVGQVDEAKKVAEIVTARAVKQENPNALIQVSSLLRQGEGKQSKELLAIAVKAARAAVRLAGDRDAQALINLASTYHVAGDRPTAREYARKAVAAAVGEPAGRKEYIEKEAKRIQDEN
jgi:thiol-disulfide isomerase/thioredoxin